MSVITGFQVQGRRKLEITVLLDDAPWTTLDAETVVRAGLSKGMTLDEAARERLLATDRVVRARRAAAGYCARGPRTRLELERYLEQRGYPATAAREALDSLEASGTLDETRAVDAVIRRRRRSGSGPRRIHAELTARGIAPGKAAERLSRALEGSDLAAECEAQARRAAARYRPLTDPAQRRKLIQFLLRRGYDGEMAQSTVARLHRENRQPSAHEELDESE